MIKGERARMIDFIKLLDSEKVRDDAYYNVTHALAGIPDADIAICESVVDAVMEAIRKNVEEQ